VAAILVVAVLFGRVLRSGRRAAAALPARLRQRPAPGPHGVGASLAALGTGGGGLRGVVSTRYPASWGLRAVTLLFAVVVLWMLRPAASTGGLDVVRSPLEIWATYAFAVAIGIVLPLRILFYAVEIDGDEILCPGLFGRSRYDLRELDWIGDGGPYTLRLYFANGEKVRIMKHLRGMAEIVDRLEGYRA